MKDRTVASPTVHVVCRCDERLLAKVRYVFDTLLMALGIPVAYGYEAPPGAPCLVYAEAANAVARDRCLFIAHQPEAWDFLDAPDDGAAAEVTPTAGANVDAYREAALRLRWFASAPYLLGGDSGPLRGDHDIGFDLVANAFYFLSSWAERRAPEAGSRRLYAQSVFAMTGAPQDTVDRYLGLLAQRLRASSVDRRAPTWPAPRWPGDATYAVVLSHDIDFVPAGPIDIAAQGARSVMRHLVRQHDPADAWRAGRAFVRALTARRDPYGCVPELLASEAKAGVWASYQVAVARRHRNDVNYSLQDRRTCDYLRQIVDAGADLCLHGSYRSTEHADWYAEEVQLLTQKLARPLGSRQHFLSFDYDTLFDAQEAAGIEYDMSMGFADRSGARAGFSFPYFPYCLREDRPYRVLEISLFLMDVTLRSYMGLKGEAARSHIVATLRALRDSGGCASVVWHPIVFGGARDPGCDRLYWDLVAEVQRSGGLATDGRTINAHWRRQAKRYESFA